MRDGESHREVGQLHADLVREGDEFLDGCEAGSVRGTTWHGIFENDAFRRAFLTQVAGRAGRRWTPAQVSFAQVREDWLDALGDLVADGLDTALVRRLIEWRYERALRQSFLGTSLKVSEQQCPELWTSHSAACRQVEWPCGSLPELLSADSGYLSEANITYCVAQGIDAYLAVRRKGDDDASLGRLPMTQARELQHRTRR